MKVSIAMPYYNREDQLIEGVYSLFKTYPLLDFVISIACDRSRPPLSLDIFPSGQRAHMLASWIEGKPEPRNPCVPINLAVNRAISRLKPDVIVLTNPEIIHVRPVIDEMLLVIKQEGPDTYVTARCEDERGVIAGTEVDYSKAGRLPVPEGAHFHFLAAFTPALWAKAGGFDPDYRFGQACEDNDWLWRVKRAGGLFRHVDTPVFHQKSTTVWNLPHNKDLFFEKWPELKP